jgi:hypothetical protein
MTQADLYLQMWRATKDPKYIRLFRKAVAEQVSKGVKKMNEKKPHVWDKDMTYTKMQWANLIGLGMDPPKLPGIQTDPSPTHVFSKCPPDGKTWTEQELLAELEGLP